MVKHFSGAMLLLIIMLNHALAACDGMVMHLPAEEHPFGFTELVHQHNVYLNDDEHSDNHELHVHVACYVSYQHNWRVPRVYSDDNNAESAVFASQQYSPPVPPPDA
ncbi:hypothetical protein QE250_01340 [Chromatiaceae bacterium AAb-1]|nr:hypothetical protein [Chromatiaceae bacterium AAb-1]